MLKLRVLTALILIPCVLLILFWAPHRIYQLVLTFILLLAANEWKALMQLPRGVYRIMWWVVLVICAWAAIYIPYLWISWLALAWWVMAAMMVAKYPNAGQWFKRYLWLRMAMGIAMLLPCWIGLLHVRSLSGGGVWVLLLLLLVWGSDIGGYFGGKWFGKHLLAPTVSPKKTVEGFIGGVLFAMILGALVILYQAPAWLLQPTCWLVLFTVSLLAVMGDLTESMFKRLQDVKDSSQLLPGHGGVLDRLDSLFAATPAFVIGLTLLLPML